MPSDSTSTSGTSRGGMISLYADLLDATSKNTSDPASGTISRAPVILQPTTSDDAGPLDDAAAAARRQQISAAALRFQPTKRPQLSAQKPKSKPSVSKASAPLTSASTSTQRSNISGWPATKSTLADWAATGDDNDVNDFYGTERRQRGGRKKRRKGKEESVIPQDWDDIYDPSRPNSYEEYKNSDERIREIREWKDRLYAHSVVRSNTSDVDSDTELRERTLKSNQYAPPSSYSVVPPDLDSIPQSNNEVWDDPTGEDAYSRRLRMSQTQKLDQASGSMPEPYSTAEPADMQPSSPSNSQAASGTISRPPVRYQLPSMPDTYPPETEMMESDQQEVYEDGRGSDDASRSLRPGQKGFAERLMTKYGWSQGSGLGAAGNGIVNPLRVQVEKRKRRPDSEGGGFVDPGGRGRIIGGKKKGSGADEQGKFGTMSEVVVLRGMVDGMDLDAEVERAGDGGLIQEIGEECGDKASVVFNDLYGRVERVFIDRKAPAVFVKFTSQLSALRAVNALEGRIFNGNTISARYYDTQKFDEGLYE
ncbi:MAG: hypothetical protein M1819_007031 [Sarea resinae]|nr:MAG: hypothetical protein M1819_007031 [Sarea resinae]